jgi:diacylglycerol kinase (ATP)
MCDNRKTMSAVDPSGRPSVTVLEQLTRATVHTSRGLVAATKTEMAFRIEIVALVLSIPLAFVFAAEAWKRLALIAVMLLILIVELLNTAIEKLSDHVTPTSHPAIGRIKDMGSAAVGVTLLLAGAVWLLAFGEWLVRWF